MINNSRERQHYLIDAAISCLCAHKTAPSRDGFGLSAGYQIERAMQLLYDAIDIEKSIKSDYD